MEKAICWRGREAAGNLRIRKTIFVFWQGQIPLPFFASGLQFGVGRGTIGQKGKRRGKHGCV